MEIRRCMNVYSCRWKGSRRRRRRCGATWSWHCRIGSSPSLTAAAAARRIRTAAGMSGRGSSSILQVFTFLFHVQKFFFWRTVNNVTRINGTLTFLNWLSSVFELICACHVLISCWWNLADNLDEAYFQTTEESEEFRREYEMRRTKQASLCLSMESNVHLIKRIFGLNLHIKIDHLKTRFSLFISLLKELMTAELKILMHRMKGWSSSLKVWTHWKAWQRTWTRSVL